MSSVAEQVRCPSCGGAQEFEESGSYECRFCLAPFTLRHAREEEERLLDEIKRWVEQRIGGAGPVGQGEGIDAQSRAYLFRKNLFPSLQTAYDRALETTLGFERFPLLPSVRSAPGDGERSPLVARREEVLELRGLRAHLTSPEVQTFAVTPDDQARIRGLDRRLQEILALCNAAHATTLRTAQGFAAARHNLLALLEPGDLDPAVADRYRALARLAGVMERALESQALSGAALAPEAEEVAAELRSAAERLERQAGSSVEASLATVAAREEARRAEELARWLRSYDAIVRRSDLAFLPFVNDALEILGAAARPEDGASLVEACAATFRAVRGEVTVLAHDSFTWTRDFAESGRKGKWLAALGLGFLGRTEEVGETEEFYVPFWLVEGGGRRWLVDACGATPERVLALEEAWADVGRALESPVVLTRPLRAPLPTVAAEQATAAVEARLRSHGTHNPLLSEPRLAFLPGARIRYSTRRGRERVVLSCLDGRLTLGESALHRLSAASRITERFQ